MFLARIDRVFVKFCHLLCTYYVTQLVASVLLLLMVEKAHLTAISIVKV